MGLYLYQQFGIEGAPGPFIVYKNKSKKRDEDQCSNTDRPCPKSSVVAHLKEDSKRNCPTMNKKVMG